MSQTLHLARSPVCRFVGVAFLVPHSSGFLLGRKNVRGQSRIVGNVRGYDFPAPPASSPFDFVQLQFSLDGINWPYIVDIPLDPTLPDFQYPVDVAIRYPYARCFVQAGATQTRCDIFLELVPDADDAGLTGPTPGPPSPIVFQPPSELVRSLSTADFAAAIPQNNSEAASFGALSRNTGRIDNVALLTAENLDFDVVFWSSAARAGGIDGDPYLATVKFSAGDATAILNEEPATYHYSAAVEIDYHDNDGAFEIHASLVPRSAGKSAQPAGAAVLLVSFRPDGP